MDFLPCYYNFKIERRCVEILNSRNQNEIDRHWKNYRTVYPHYLQINNLIARDFSWQSNLFLPQDECYILFRQWKKNLSDDLVFSIFLANISAIFNKEIPDYLIVDTRIPLERFIDKLNISHSE
jgi:hypothetical protein